MAFPNPRSLGVALLIPAWILLSTAGSAWAGSSDLAARSKAAVTPNAKNWKATVKRTSYGIPHILAEDWGSLGYGYGYAFAQDNLCELAREVVVSNGELSRYFGEDGGNLDSDFFWKFWSSDDAVQRFIDDVDPVVLEVVGGYAAGYNRYLRDTGPSALPEDCRDEPWVREITTFDLFKVYNKLVGLAGASNLLPQIVGAEPPPVAAASTSAASAPKLATFTSEDLRKAAPGLVWNPGAVGSNMIALGKDATENGRGVLLVNPHFPWSGSLRFYQVHVTIPGVIDSMGASIFGSPLPNIAFNKDVAWSHTVSAAGRFTLLQLEIVPGSPTSYMFDGEVRDMTSTTVSVDVLEDDDSITTREHTFWESHFGPIASITPFLGWSSFAAFTVFDANRDNTRIFNQYLRMNQARSVRDLARALEEEVALPWVNTAAADRKGKAYYADIGAIPHLTNAQFEACEMPVSELALGLGVYLTDGSRSECEPGTDSDAPQPGIFGASNLPSLKRKDYVQNSNDSYWLANPEEPLEGFADILGGEREEQGLRTRLGIVQARERLAGTDGLPGDRYSVEALRAILFGNRNLSAELMLDDVLTVCGEEPNDVDVDGETVDVGPACSVLTTWDRTMNLDAVGALVWRVLWPNVRRTDDLYAIPFDVADPANTPRGVNLGDGDVRSAIMEGLGETVAFLAEEGLALDSAWGDVHFDVKNGVEIPIHGGPGDHGVYNAIGAPFSSGEGYTPVTAGSSIVMGVTFGKKGPKARGVLTYSQSTDPASPHYSDQTQLFSTSEWQDLPFTRDEIKNDPNFSKQKLKEARR